MQIKIKYNSHNSQIQIKCLSRNTIFNSRKICENPLKHAVPIFPDVPACILIVAGCLARKSTTCDNGALLLYYINMLFKIIQAAEKGLIFSINTIFVCVSFCAKQSKVSLHGTE